MAGIQRPFESPRHDQMALVTISDVPKFAQIGHHEGISAYMRAHLLTGGHICEVHWGISAYMRAYLLPEGHIRYLYLSSKLSKLNKAKQLVLFIEIYYDSCWLLVVVGKIYS